LKKNAEKTKQPSPQALQQRLLKHDLDFLERGFKSLAGVDEAGRGPLAGPVVASAVIVRDFSFSAPVNDSKKMSEKARELAYEEILAKCVIGIGIVDCETIDRIDIFQATLRAMEQAVMKLGEIPGAILVDGPKTPNLPFKQFPIIDGDALSFSIACASVVAKVTRDRMMVYYAEEFPQYGFEKHKGYGTRDHMEAIRKNGPCKIHRRSFEPIKSLYGNSFNY
jgi:ribonuclease HII